MKRLKFLSGLIAILLFLLTGISQAGNGYRDEASQTVRVLTIGNSFSENACKYLKQITESVDGCNIVIGKANVGGCSLEQHADLIKKGEKDPTFKPYWDKSSTLKELLLKEDWDVVTIQQVSHMSFKAETFQPYADEIVEYVKKYAPQAKIYIHETWAYAPDCPRLEGFGINNEQMHQGLQENYKTLSNRYNAPILPSGDAFISSWKKDKELDLWSPKDRFHANMNGCYLAGCVWFGKLFGISPKKIVFKPEGMDSKTSDYLKSIASKVK